MGSAERRFVMQPAGKAAWVVVMGLGGALPLLVMLPLLAASEDPTSRWVLGGSVAFVVALCLWLGLSMRRLELTLHGDRLQVRAAMYRRAVALSEIDLDAAWHGRVPDPARLPGPLLKLNGFAAPGFHAGHFRFGLGGGCKAFAAFARRDRVLVLPLRDGSVLALGPESPDTVLQVLRDARGTGA